MINTDEIKNKFKTQFLSHYNKSKASKANSIKLNLNSLTNNPKSDDNQDQGSQSQRNQHRSKSSISLDCAVEDEEESNPQASFRSKIKMGILNSLSEVEDDHDHRKNFKTKFSSIKMRKSNHNQDHRELNKNEIEDKFNVNSIGLNKKIIGKDKNDNDIRIMNVNREEIRFVDEVNNNDHSIKNNFSKSNNIAENQWNDVEFKMQSVPAKNAFEKENALEKEKKILSSISMPNNVRNSILSPDKTIKRNSLLSPDKANDKAHKTKRKDKDDKKAKNKLIFKNNIMSKLGIKEQDLNKNTENVTNQENKGFIEQDLNKIISEITSIHENNSNQNENNSNQNENNSNQHENNSNQHENKENNNKTRENIIEIDKVDVQEYITNTKTDSSNNEFSKTLELNFDEEQPYIEINDDNIDNSKQYPPKSDAFSLNKTPLKPRSESSPKSDIIKDRTKCSAKVNEITAMSPELGQVDFNAQGWAHISDLNISGIQSEDIVKFNKLMSPCGVNMEQCTLTRQKTIWGESTYTLKLSEGHSFIMGAKKKQSSTGQWLISMQQDIFDKSRGQMGKLRANFAGDRFIMQSVGEAPENSRDSRFWREELGGIFYEFLLSNKKSPRQIKVFLPKVRNNFRQVVQPGKQGEKGITNSYDKNQKENQTILKNKEPKWNDTMSAQVLNFKGRVSEPSIKNFQLVSEYDQLEDVCLQFGKDGDSKYHLDFKYPFSPFQAFCVAISSFGWKMYE